MMQLANIIVAGSKMSRTQRTARRVMIAACSIIGLGVLGAIASNAVAGKASAAKFVDEHASSPLTAMATDRSGAELLHNQTPVATKSHVVMMNVTAYCPCPKCCGKNAHGVTASGKAISFNGGHFVAAPAQYSFGTQLLIPGYNGGQPVQVLDRGGAIKGNHLDVFFPTHEQARAWGRRMVGVTVMD
jgi:3D (Asp-Asp-Asp) domain-containing protein